MAGIVHAEAHRGQGAQTPLADGVGRGDEGLQTGALRRRAEAVEQDADLLFGQVAGEDGPQGFLSGRFWLLSG